MENSTISVIIPCFNHGEFLNETIESVLSQTFKNYEIIIVDDGSTDVETLHSLEHLKKKYPDIKIIHQPNGGPANARNNGIKIARGDFFFPLDSDDTIEPRMLEKCLKALLKNPKAGFAYTFTRFFGTEEFVWKNPKYNFYDLLWANQSTVSALVRKEAWEEVGGFDESRENLYEDWEFWINLGKHGWHGQLVGEPLFNYRKSKESRVKSSELKYGKAVKYIRKKHRDLYAKESLKKIRRKWKPRTLRNIFVHIDSRLEGAGLFDRELWKKHPVDAFGRLIPIRIKRKINSLLGKRIFDTSYYRRSGG